MAPSQIASQTSGPDSPTNAPSFDNTNQTSQTAKDFIDTQVRLEADAREALPYAFDTCTQPLGPLRQNLFSCLTCNPPPASPTDDYTPAAVCYSCSIACHGEHTLVELFNRRNFVCDCGTRRLPATSPCTIRIDPTTGMKGPVNSEDAAVGNTYNQNCRNRFCGCGEEYNADKEKGTMFQCLGLADEKDGGCGEDWWHPECVVWGGEEGMRKRKERSKRVEEQTKATDEVLEDPELPPGFPDEEDFETFICYKCVEAAPWLKQYAGAEGFLPALYRQDSQDESATNGHLTKRYMSDDSVVPQPSTSEKADDQIPSRTATNSTMSQNGTTSPRKRSADTAGLDNPEADSITKKAKSDENSSTTPAYHTTLPSAPSAILSLFCKEDFRDHLCRCKICYPRLSAYPQLLEEEEAYEPPLSESGKAADGTGSVGSKSILERGEAALNNVDRVRAIGESP